MKVVDIKIDIKKIFLFTVVFLFALEIFAQQNLEDTARGENDTMRSANSGFAEEEFRRGVQSYYRGAYIESINLFENALSYLPGENLILDWLGKSYYKAGLEGAALSQWNYALNNNYGGILLQNKIEIVSERRLTDIDYDFKEHYTALGSFPNSNGNNLIYSQPISSLPCNDGSIWVVAYGSNEILQFDVNGLVTKRSRGPLNGFDRPTDIIRLRDGNLLVCESAGDRLSVLNENGQFIKYIGEKGRGIGQFVGPQYLAQDSLGNIYVTDFGNSRVCVFDEQGNGLFYFGNKTANFKGFKSPTGIAIVNDRIFVADSVNGEIYEFDRAGNYISLLVDEKTFARPECIKTFGDYLILTDSNRVVCVDTSSGSVYENARTGKSGTNITSAVPDRNGNIIVTDFKSNEIYIMAKMSELVGGFFVQIEKVIADNFPTVILEVKVENRKRQSIVGLKSENFLITEGKRPVAEMEFLGCANYNDFADITFLIDRNLDMQNYENQVNVAIQEISASMNNQGTVQIISAGKIPIIEYKGNPASLREFSVGSLNAPYSSYIDLDQSMRLAANNLINGEKKRAVIYITSGNVSEDGIKDYGLSDISAYYNNNSISFNTVMLSQKEIAPEISYLTQNTNGSQYFIYREEGLSQIISDIINIPIGLYQFRYTSTLPTEFGRRYLPVEIETYLLNRSGRDESGYFAPLQ